MQSTIYSFCLLCLFAVPGCYIHLSNLTPLNSLSEMQEYLYFQSLSVSMYELYFAFILLMQ